MDVPTGQTFSDMLPLSVASMLVDATGKITKPGAFGTGFFVTNRVVLTCFHVLNGRDVARKSTITLRWKGRDEETLSLLPECQCPQDEPCGCDEGLFISGKGGKDWALVSCSSPTLRKLPDDWAMHFEESYFDDVQPETKIVVCGHPRTGKLGLSSGKVLSLKGNGWFSFDSVQGERSVGGTSGGPVFRLNGKGLAGILASTSTQLKNRRNGPLLSFILSGVMEGKSGLRERTCLAHFQKDCLRCCSECVKMAKKRGEEGELDKAVMLMCRARKGDCQHLKRCSYFDYGCMAVYKPCPPRCSCDSLSGEGTKCDKSFHNSMKKDFHLKILKNAADALAVCFPASWKRTLGISHMNIFEEDGGFFAQKESLSLVITSSSSDPETGAFKGVFRSTPRRLYNWTKDEKNSWICVDLGRNARMAVTQYSMQHGQGWSANSLREWKLEGREQGEDKWVLLSKHTNDETLSGSFAVGCWEVDSVPDRGFRYFRITQTGPNSKGNEKLCVTSLMFYGVVGTCQGDNGEDKKENEIVREFVCGPDSGLFQGVIDWLGSVNGKYSKARVNEVVKTKCYPRLSLELEGEGGELWIGKARRYCYTEDKEGSWFSVDLGEYWVCPTKYSLRHGMGWGKYAVRNWTLQGSLDEKNWVDISVHLKDETISQSFGVGTWEVNRGGERAFRYFRILETGVNSSGNFVLALSGFELFGTLQKRKE